MRFELTSHHREFFFQRHFIELADLLSKEECDTMRAMCDRVLFKQLGDEHLDRTMTEEELFLAGRDLFRHDSEIKRFAQKRQFAELFSQISHKKPLRLLYTQYLRTFDKVAPQGKQLPFLHSDHMLGESGSFQGIYGAIIITFSTSRTNLPHAELSIKDDVTVICPTATEVGNVVLVNESSPLSFAPLYSSPNEAHLMLVYGESNTVYRRSETDPLAHFPKTLGYSFGDVLKEELNPIVYR